ncbi:LysM peptidoglycan-binding domain-containing protein [Treponema sp. Marseille-Q4132]|uniref:Hsp70 family protein n=1 Tax=Treponema sp. Marseille-Q4132 TaxID=2766701 RepID=UPI001652CEA1|nr:LysM peptidoglycan-binding domain-containing protein [Treponema sp. Marseille-Q4132]QNL96491.1 LysM peptidoglycan-binding domain-containing protein [Treponema sp. Marseille-Q4132]
MKMIGIKLADGSFYPLLEEGVPAKKTLDLTTARDNQTAIIVDLYRSETNSMEGAEYAASLQIDNLVAQPNGEPDISFTVALDEDNKLFAEINDGKSGGRNTVTVSLVERAVSEHTDSDNLYGPAITAGAALAAGGLMHAASKEKSKDDALDFSDLDLPEELDLIKPVSASAESVSDTANDAADIMPESTMFSPPDFSSPEAPGKSGFDAESFDASDDVRFGDIDISTFDAEPQTEQTLDGSGDFHFDAVDLPSFDELETQKADGNASSESSEDNAVFGSADIPVSNDVFSDTESASDVQAASGSADDFHFDASDLPVFDETPPAQSDVSDIGAASGSDSFSDDFFDGIDIPANETDGAARNIDSLDDLEFGETDDTKTQEGTTATKYQPEKTIKKKTKVPVLICLLCALICVIAAILILFVIPSKYNVLLSRASHQNDIFVLTPKDTPAAPQETQVLPAKPDEIVVAPKAEALAPVRPAAASKSTGDIVYRIKWGDTLWDIADAYYKNPWRYPRIARYNNIKNPDYIISGTTIRIPAE